METQSVLTSLISGQHAATRNTVIALVLGLLVVVGASYLYKSESRRNYALKDWLKSLGIYVAIIALLLLGDALLGLLFHPELPLWQSGTQHIGFTISAFLMIFLVPMVLAEAICTIRAAFARKD
jgi:hypothetical protein